MTQFASTIFSSNLPSSLVPARAFAALVIAALLGGVATAQTVTRVTNPTELFAARDALRSKSRASGWTGAVIELAAGTYKMKDFKLDSPDSGTAGKPVVYRAAADAADKVFIDGGGTAGLLVVLGDVQHIEFRGLTFRKAHGGIAGYSPNHIRIAGCTFEDITAESPWQTATILLGGGNRATLQSSGHIIEDCIFRRCSWGATESRPAIWLIDSVGTIVRRCRFEDLAQFAVWAQGNNYIIEDNVAIRCCQALNWIWGRDQGVFYCGQDPTARGTIIRRNTITDVGGLNDSKAYNIGIYLDDGASGITVEDNVISGSRWGVLLGGGRDNILRNNRFTDCDVGIRFDGRFVEWAPWNTTTKRKQVTDALAKMPYASAAWAAVYPTLATLRENNIFAPIGNVFAGNSATDGSKLYEISAGAKPWFSEQAEPVPADTVPSPPSGLEAR